MGIRRSNTIVVTFTSLIDNSSLSITLYSKFTCIYGIDSSEGKTQLYDVIAEGRTGALDGEVTISVSVSNPSYKFTQETGASIEAVLGRKDEKYIIMVDEYSILSGEMISKAKKSEHVFLCVTRAMPWSLSYPLQGLYIVSRSLTDDGELSFDLNHYNGLPILKEISDSYDYIVTESSPNHSEHELLSLYFSNLVPASGRDKINRVLLKLCKSNPNCKILVFADLGNIGQAVHLLEQRVKENPNIIFYDYVCFEQLLYESKLIKSLGKKSDINRFSVLSLEEYFSKKLEIETQGSYLEYKHGKPLKEGYKLQKNFNDLYSSRVSRLLKKYIELYKNK